MRYRANHASRKENPWGHALDSLKEKRKVAPEPRRLADWQKYMGRPEVSDKIDNIFQERWPEANRPNADKLAFRGEIARELLASEGEDVKAELKAECEATLKKDLLTYDADETVNHELPDEEAKSKYVFLDV